jgi:hypothetical protein
MSTYTQSSTYTTTDVGKVVDRFTADYHMIAQATGLAGRDHVVEVAHDIKALAKRGYIAAVSIVLRNAANDVLRANKYTVSTDAAGWVSDRPGDNMWPRQVGGKLNVVISYTPAWFALTAQQQQAVEGADCILPWTATDIDTSFPGLPSTVDRRYSSNAYGMERRSFGSGI